MVDSKELIAAFSLSGLVLKQKAADLLSARIEEDEENIHIEDLIDKLIASELKSNIINKKCISKFMDQAGFSQATNDNPYTGDHDLDTSGSQSISFEIISAFDIPRWRYDMDRAQFYERTNKPKKLSEARDKASLFVHRYVMVLQRLMRHNFFRPKTTESDTRVVYELTPLQALVSQHKKGGVLYVFGMITQIEEGAYYLEDPDARVRLNMENAEVKAGVFTECCFLLVEGTYNHEEDCLMVNSMAFPPAEKRDDSLDRYRHINFFGGSLVRGEKYEALKMLEEKTHEEGIFIMSDVFLDKAEVMEKLEGMFDIQATEPAAMVVFMGNFLSPSVTKFRSRMLGECLDRLAALIARYPRWQETTHFVFVPGPGDPGSGDCIPRPPLPRKATETITQTLAHVSFTSNPCRIRCNTKEIVFFREDLSARLLRNAIVFPTVDVMATEGNETIHGHVLKTIIDQQHLCPLSLHKRPIFWDFDTALSLFPLPDTVVIADRYQQYRKVYKGCFCINPGSFMESNFQFMQLYPMKKTAEECDLSMIDKV